jgi:5-methylcytosine-specific restriction endonuclease McrA
MPANKPPTSRLDQVVADAIRNRQTRESGYREQALKIYPWICGRCAREFTRENLQQLTVHHRDHNHDNNPTNGSNWELLCLYCHDNEHSRELDAEAARQAGVVGSGKAEVSRATAQPFANLKDLLRKNER